MVEYQADKPLPERYSGLAVMILELKASGHVIILVTWASTKLQQSNLISVLRKALTHFRLPETMQP